MPKDLSKAFEGKKLGLALGGGAARGVAHLGALKAFEEYGLEFDLIAGTSVGSLVGACYAAGVHWKDMYDAVKGMKVSDLLNWKKWHIGYDSITIAEFLEDIMGKKNFENLDKPFKAVAVSVKKAEEKIFAKGDVSLAVRASCTVPGVFVPIELEDDVIVDGGVLNNVPSNVVRDMGADVIFAIDLNGELPDIEVEGKLLETLYAVFNIMVRNNSQLGYHDADHVIAPCLSNYPYHSIKKAEEMFERGYEATIELLEQI